MLGQGLVQGQERERESVLRVLGLVLLELAQGQPRRLARRYLIQGPPSYRALQRDSFVKMSTSYFAEPAATMHPVLPRIDAGAAFRPEGEHADVAAVVVTYNNVDDIEPLVASLRRQAEGQSIRLVVVDNDSTPCTRTSASSPRAARIASSRWR